MAKISHNYYYIIFTFVIVAIDQIIKAQMTLKELFVKNEELFLFNNLNLSYSNKLFLAIIMNIIFIFIFWIILNKFNLKTKKTIFLLVSSGLISNLIDRIFKSYVVDYIVVSNIVFNLADMVIWIGVLLFIFSIFKDLFMMKDINYE
jgi:signal peptidase II